MKRSLLYSAIFSLFVAQPVFANVSSSAKKGATTSDQILARKPTVVKSPRKLEMEQQLKRDQKLVLEKKNEMEGRTSRPLPTAKEKQLFEELVQAFERNDELSFASRYQAMMREHPRGVYADETLYLGGMMAFANKQYGKAIKLFSQVIKDYPRSGKVRAALFAKGAAYKRMNLAPQATTTFASLKRAFPGSPEAKRADVELRLIK